VQQRVMPGFVGQRQHLQQQCCWGQCSSRWGQWQLYGCRCFW
jgi:hypothetical protein